MAGMRSLVPSLIAVGRENFFLDLRHNLELSPEQSQQLYFIRQRYVANSDELENQLAQAQLGLYQNLGEDTVSSPKLESDLKKIAELKAEISALHFKAALEAVNVLDHRQHLRARELLKLRMEMWQQTSSKPEARSIAVSRTPLAHLIGRPQWPSNFTPRDLWWKGW
jgi:Spy/CpxP family protein refolding chaperone